MSHIRCSRLQVGHGLGALLGVLLVLLGGCTAGRTGSALRFTSGPRPSASTSEVEGSVGGWPDVSSSDTEKLLALFLACTSPAEFVALQRRVDMARLVEGLDDWSAVRVGALGPVLPEAAEVLNRKRASYLVTVTREYGVAQAEVFALYVLHSAFDEDVKQVLRHLAQEKRLGQTLARMAVAREHLGRRGLPLSAYPDRPEHPLDDSLRGAREGMGELLSSAPMFQTGPMLSYVAQKGQLPLPYRQALDEVEIALAKQALEPGNVLLGMVDELTFGVPLGFYYLAAGVGQGVSSLSEGQYEQASRELTPAALMVALYAGGKGARAARGLQGLEPRLNELKATAQRLQVQLGGEGLEAVARYLRADPDAALLVIDGGEAGAAALYEARGNVPKARHRPGCPRGSPSGPVPPGRGVGSARGRAAWPPWRTRRRASPGRCWRPGSWRWRSMSQALACPGTWRCWRSNWRRWRRRRPPEPRSTPSGASTSTTARDASRTSSGARR
ncbi:hypothetical protein [Archangium sp.]|uniref:hypothetical protein n=1 Tax=Archangium sp. TaxID=1872627 RepID=UPI00286C3563|nr:hypothetical protein [Archangium sp.]